MTTALKDNQFDVVIVGAGIAGMTAALNFYPLRVAVVSDTLLGFGNSSKFAQGGIAVPILEFDSLEQHIEDTIDSGRGLCDRRVAFSILSEAPQMLEDLQALGNRFDKSQDGNYSLSKEACHSFSRIIKIDGDRTGWHIMNNFVNFIKSKENISCFEEFRFISYCDKDDSESEKLGLNNFLVSIKDLSDGSLVSVFSKYLIFCTGGIGALYSHSTNPSNLRGDCQGFLASKGALLADLEFVQFHPTCMKTNSDNFQVTLISEAIRGAGARIVSKNCEPVLPRFNIDEFSGRDLVSQALHRLMWEGEDVYIDARNLDTGSAKYSFPFFYQQSRMNGFDTDKDLVPITPAQHYHMGGVLTDDYGRTTINNVFVIGEAGCTGLHGANRLASNSLLEAFILAKRVATLIKGDAVGFSHGTCGIDLDLMETFSFENPGKSFLSKQELALKLANLPACMSESAGIIRSDRGMRGLISFIRDIKHNYFEDSTLSINSINLCELMVVAMMARKESRGGHFRSDYCSAADGFRFRMALQYDGKRDKIRIFKIK